ncbi:basic proline-rich protein-like [Vidua macroura]|uniref:basic proline-rich protein-like n=1 Tax=Vidua macroura TaxID=187451 RepID=UPI0023A89DEF|nr:basic proline-rich protein-like [Vidua macroura]
MNGAAALGSTSPTLPPPAPARGPPGIPGALTARPAPGKQTEHHVEKANKGRVRNRALLPAAGTDRALRPGGQKQLRNAPECGRGPADAWKTKKSSFPEVRATHSHFLIGSLHLCLLRTLHCVQLGRMPISQIMREAAVAVEETRQQARREALAECLPESGPEAGGRQGSVLRTVRCPAGGRDVGPGRVGAEPSGTAPVPAPSHAFPPPHVPAAPPASHCTEGPRALAPPARRPPPANGKPVARQRAHLNGPIRRPSPSPSLYGDRGMRSLIRSPATCPAHLLPDAPPTSCPTPRPLPPPRVERGKSAQRRAGRRGEKAGGKKGRGGRSPAAGSASSGRKGGQLEWKIPGRRPRVASAALPHGPAAPLLASPGFLLESQPACTGGSPGVLRPEGSAPLPGHFPSEPQHLGAERGFRLASTGPCGVLRGPAVRPRCPAAAAERTLF